MLYTHIVLQLSSASSDLYHTIYLPIVSPVVILTSTRTKFPEVDQFSRKFWSRGTNFSPKILVRGTKIFRTKIPVTDPPPTAYLETKDIASNTYHYDDLLPPLPATSPRPYYYYEGSFTTPLCTERVQWFMLKDNITIPAFFLAKLRQVKREGNANSPLLTFNFRDLQPLNARNVSKFS